MRISERGSDRAPIEAAAIEMATTLTTSATMANTAAVSDIVGAPTLDEPLDADERLAKLRLARGVAAADMALADLAEAQQFFAF